MNNIILVIATVLQMIYEKIYFPHGIFKCHKNKQEKWVRVSKEHVKFSMKYRLEAND